MRELPGKSPKTSGEVRGTSGEVRGLPRSSGEPDSLPATRQVCLQSDLPIEINVCNFELFKLGGFKKALRPFSAELPKPHSDTYFERSGSDFGGPSGCNSDFHTVTLILAL